MAAEQDKGFLGRWSSRKAAVREGKPVAEPVPVQHFDKLSVNGGVGNAGLVNTSGQVDNVRTEPVEVKPALTLEDVTALTPASDFSGFVAKGVDTAVKNAAMKKLFSDPHYNIMDGLDIYIGDYSTHDVLPQSVIDEMTKDGFLNMFQKEEIPEEKATAHDDPDLQLQRDDAARLESAGDGALRPLEAAAGAEAAQPALPPPST
jgi:hypothetical protein